MSTAVPLVVVDTNIFFADLEMARNEFKHLLDVSRRGSLRLYVPEVVIQECVRHYRRGIEQVVGTAKKGLSAMQRLGLTDLAIDAASMSAVAEKRVADYEPKLRADLMAAGAEVLALPTVSHGLLLERALAERKPFKAKQGGEGSDGYRDALIWASVTELCARIEDSDTLLLVTDNYKDFGYQDKADLHADLRADLDGRWATHRLGSLDALFEFPSIAAAAESAVEEAPRLSEAELAQLLSDPITVACQDLVYLEIEDAGLDDRFGDGRFSQVPLPWGAVQTITVSSVDADTSGLSFKVLDSSAEGSLLVEVRVDAELDFEGFMMKADYYVLDDDEDGVRLLEFDWNDHMMHVGMERAVTLVFSAYVDPLEREVSDVELTEAVPQANQLTA